MKELLEDPEPTYLGLTTRPVFHRASDRTGKSGETLVVIGVKVITQAADFPIWSADEAERVNELLSVAKFGRLSNVGSKYIDLFAC